MNTVLHKAKTRGYANHGWLETYHTFSFADYHDPERVRFGVLRVLNDDRVSPGRGFGWHPHDNMEIITIPLEGDLEHKDSMGNTEVIRHGEVQVMSAGTGIMHSEYNASQEKDVKLLQIWVFPDTFSLKPRYDQISLKDVEKENTLYQILSPVKDDQGVWIHQQAWFYMGKYDKETTETYYLKSRQNGVYFFLINGEAVIEGTELSERDGFGVWETDKIEITTKPGTRILVMEVPMR